MIIPDALNKTFLNNQTRLLSGISFFVISLISLHFIFYQNFYNFSDSWIEKESRMVTIQISPNKGEKRVPENIIINILDFFSKNEKISFYKYLDAENIKKDLALDDLNSFSNIRIPMVLQVLKKTEKDNIDFEDLLFISENREIKIHQHKEDLFEIKGLIQKVKIFIFLFGLIITFLFFFLLTSLLRTTLIANYRFLDIMQIIGDDSKSMSVKLAIIIVKKIIPGSIVGMIFASFISAIIINIFNIPFHNHLNFFNSFFKEIFLLSIFISFVLFFLFIYLLIYLFYFLEKRFFA